jgi:Holliday junction resolvasome RuvABC endonuclease subunit
MLLRLPPIWGIDLGARSWHAARIDDGHHTVYSCQIKPKKIEERAKILRTLSVELATLLDGSDPVYIEEPVVAGARNLRTSLMLAHTAGALMSRIAGPVTLVPVSSWKKEVCGHGGLSKQDIWNWLKINEPMFFDNCLEDQNKIDATCISMYGVIQEYIKANYA